MQCYGSIFHSKRMQAMRRATKQNGSTSKYGKSPKQTITLKYLFSALLVLNTKMATETVTDNTI